MTVSSLERVLDQLLKTGLISKRDFRELRERQNPDDTLPSVAGVTRKLVTSGVLTQFQADQLCDGQSERLVLGEYVLIDLLGTGGMGEVYLARHQMMEREVAIKLLVPKSSELIESVERFKREVRAAARLSHPNIVSALDAGVRDGQYYLVMEYVRGRNLSMLVKSRGTVRLDRALDYVIQAGQGLEYAHRQVIIHRDVKPSNLLVGEDGTVKVSDLGLSRVLKGTEQVKEVNSQGDGLTSSGMIMGTVDFMSPEQAVSPRDADERADIYGLGCTLYYLATGETVFHGDTPMGRLIAHREEAVPKFTDAVPHAPPELNDVFSRMLAKDPDDRYMTMSDALRDLRSCLRQVQEKQSSVPDTQNRPLEKLQTRRMSRAVGLTLLAGATVAFAAFSWWQPWPADRSLAGIGMSEGELLQPAHPDPVEEESSFHRITVDSPPTDVLQLIDLETVRKTGSDWHFEEDGANLIMGKGAAIIRIGLPVVVPDSYWLTVDVRRVPDSRYTKGPFVVGLAVGSGSCYAAFDAHRATGQRISFMGSSRFTGATLVTSPFCRIPDDEFVTVRIEISVDGPDSATVRAGIDDSELMEWTGKPDDIEIRDGWASGWPEQLTLCTNLETGYVIRGIHAGPGRLPPLNPAPEQDAARVPQESAGRELPAAQSPSP